VPTISLIAPQKKTKDRFNIFLDDKFAFGISSFTLLEHNLKVGKVLEAEDIETITKKEELAKLLELATNYLSYRPRSEKEVTDYLVKKIATHENIKFNQAKESTLVPLAIKKLKKYKYLDDNAFAKWWLESRLRSHPKSLRQIKIELKQKGIGQEILESFATKSVNEKDIAKKAIEKKIKKWQALPALDFKKKVYQYLLSRGFGYDTTCETFAFFSKKR